MIVTTFVYISRDAYRQDMDMTADEAVIGTTLEVQGEDK